MSRLSLGHSWVKEQKRWQVTWALKSSGQRRQRRRRQKEQVLSLLHSAVCGPTHSVKVFNLFLTAWFLGLLPLHFCREAKKGAGAPLPHPYKFSFGPVLEVVLSGSCIFANGWLAKGLSGALASGAFWVEDRWEGKRPPFGKLTVYRRSFLSQL